MSWRRTAVSRQPDTEIIIQAYNEKFGLDKPLWQQYVTYMGEPGAG